MLMQIGSVPDISTENIILKLGKQTKKKASWIVLIF